MKLMLEASEVAVLLFGDEKRVDFIWKMAREKKLPHLRLGRRVLFNREVIEAWSKGMGCL